MVDRAKRRWLFLGLAVLVLGAFAVAIIGVASFSSSPAQTVRLVQDVNPEVAVTPGDLGRLSWGAVIAGALLALMLQLALNLLGVGIGATTLEANTDTRADNDTEAGSMAKTALVWIAFTTILALFIGGWMAGRFAGVPNNLDGLLHGLLVWAVVTIITILLLTSTVGRFISGTTALIGQGLNLATRAAGAVTTGAANVVGGVARGVAHTAANAAQDTQTAAHDPTTRLNQVIHTIEDTVRNAIEQSPEVKDALDRQNLSQETIQHEAEILMRQAGIPPEQVQGEAQQAVNELRDAAQQAAQQVTHDPQEAIRTMSLALRRVFRHGQTVIDQADRQSLIDVIRSRTGKSPEEAEQIVQGWEQRFNQARAETERVRTEARQRIEKMQAEMQQKAEEARAEAERVAREAARGTSKAVSRLAIAIFATLVIGAAAAGVGGLVGAPEELPVAEIDTTSSEAQF
jgi:hypothetical protein